MSRPSKREYFLQMATLVSQRGTCGFQHCTDVPCEGANAASGTDLDKCMAVHAEINAIIQCKDCFEVDTAYVTVSPCIQCIKALLNTSCQNLVFLNEYPHPESKEFWLKAGRFWNDRDEAGRLYVAAA